MKNAGKELLIFLAVTYGLTFLMGIPMAILFSPGERRQLLCRGPDVLPRRRAHAGQADLPEGRPPHAEELLFGISGAGGGHGPALPAGLHPAGGAPVSRWGLPADPGRGRGVAALSLEPKERREAYGLAGKNWPQSIPLLGLFLVFYLTEQLLPSLILEGPAAWTASLSLDANMGWLIYSVPFSILASFISLFGEEYGWRTYFQPLLQEKAGRIKGVFLFGVLWELWHLPLVLCYYAPQAAGSTLAQVLCMRYGHVILLAVFLAYAYGKTGNLWLPVLIHGMNNTLSGVLQRLFPGMPGQPPGAFWASPCWPRPFASCPSSSLTCSVSRRTANLLPPKGRAGKTRSPFFRLPHKIDHLP